MKYFGLEHYFIKTSKDLKKFEGKSRSTNHMEPCAISIDKALFHKHHTVLLSQCNLQVYHASYESDDFILVRPIRGQKLPPPPNTIVGTHVFIYSKHKNKIHVLVTKENGNIGIPGGHIDLKDKNLSMSLSREFNEELGKTLTLKPKLKLIRLINKFPRFSGLYKSNDIWFLFACKVSSKTLQNLASKKTLQNGDGEVDDLLVMPIDEIQTKWLTPDIITTINESGSLSHVSSKNVYDNLEGVIIF